MYIKIKGLRHGGNEDIPQKTINMQNTSYRQGQPPQKCFNRYSDFQPESLFSDLSTIKSQMAFSLDLPPDGSPK